MHPGLHQHLLHSTLVPVYEEFPETIIWNVLIQLGGGVIDQNMVSLLQELLTNPTSINDLMPFILGLEPEANRSAMSWDYSDMFLWAAYEHKTLDIP